MTLTRALPAFLALSLLTGCDINAFLLKPPDGKGAITNPDPNEGQLQLSEAELKSVNALSGGLFGALDQGSATAGVVNTLKSVAAFTGGAKGYRISSADESIPDTIDWDSVVLTPVDEDHPQHGKLKDKFVGKYGEGTNSWHLVGDFTLPDGLTAAGTASILTNGQEASFDKMGDFAAKVKVELDVEETPDNLGEDVTALAGSRFDLTIDKPKGPIQDYLSGNFTMTKDDVTSNGLLEVDLLNETWTITIFSKGDQNKDVAIRLTYDPEGGSVARVYDVKNLQPGQPMVPDFDNLRGQFTGTSATGSGLNFIPATFMYRSESGGVATIKRNGN